MVAATFKTSENQFKIENFSMSSIKKNEIVIRIELQTVLSIHDAGEFIDYFKADC